MKRNTVKPQTLKGYEIFLKIIVGPILQGSAQERVHYALTGNKPHRDAKLLRMLGDFNVSEVTTGQLRSWHAQIRDEAGAVTAARAMSMLKAILAIVQEDYGVRVCPIPTNLPKRKSKPKKDISSADEVGQLLAYAKDDHARGIFVAFPFLTGCRVSEQLGLLWDDVDMDAGTLRICRIQERDGSLTDQTKTEAGERDVLICATLRQMLLEWRLNYPGRDGELHRVFPGAGVPRAWPQPRIGGGAFQSCGDLGPLHASRTRGRGSARSAGSRIWSGGMTAYKGRAAEDRLRMLRDACTRDLGQVVLDPQAEDRNFIAINLETFDLRKLGDVAKARALMRWSLLQFGTELADGNVGMAYPWIVVEVGEFGLSLVFSDIILFDLSVCVACPLEDLYAELDIAVAEAHDRLADETLWHEHQSLADLHASVARKSSGYEVAFHKTAANVHHFAFKAANACAHAQTDGTQDMLASYASCAALAFSAQKRLIRDTERLWHAVEVAAHRCLAKCADCAPALPR